MRTENCREANDSDGKNWVCVCIVVFIILVIINFMVITKGAGRIAEVGARFVLEPVLDAIYRS